MIKFLESCWVNRGRFRNSNSFSLQFNSGVLGFVCCNFPLVLQLGQSCGSLFVHFFLKILSLHSILFVHLFQDVELVGLSGKGLFCCSRFEFCILLRNGGFHLLFLIIDKPVSLSFLLLLEQYILFSWLVDIFEQVDSGLVFSLPLSISHFELSLGFLGYFFIHSFFESRMFVCWLFVVLLKFLNFISSLHFFGFF